MQIVRRVYHRIMSKTRNLREIAYVDDCSQLAERAHWIDGAKLRLYVPIHMIRMQGAFVYGPSHPFVRALTLGEGALTEFYDRVQPKNICEYYSIDGAGRTGSDLPPWELPWYGRRERLPPPGEAGLGGEHGVSFYGPVTEKKVHVEYRRLSELKARIDAHGYAPDEHGDIEGYGIRDGARVCFFVRGGKHRASVLASMGFDHIPVSFRDNFPRLVDAAQVEFWPLVRSGAMDRSLALEILTAYVSGRSEDI